jgi:hypothetical protein
VSALRNANELRNVVFVSTNYDILIDNALAEEQANGIDLDYGVEFRNFDRPGDWKRPAFGQTSPVIQTAWFAKLAILPDLLRTRNYARAKGGGHPADLQFYPCGLSAVQSVYSPLIVPPTFYKDLNNVFLSAIWNRTDVALRKVTHIIFCGYSFPDADIHIKYLLKRAQTNRDTPRKVTVINHYKDKKADSCKQEEYRYKRFLGGTANYTDKSFEQFADDPLMVLRPIPK